LYVTRKYKYEYNVPLTNQERKRKTRGESTGIKE
jgi:hypothetical protein